MSRSRLAPLLIEVLLAMAIGASPALATGADGGGIDSLVPLPDWSPQDPEAGLVLIPHALISDPVGRPWLLDRSRGRVARMTDDGAARSFAANDPERGLTPVSDIAASGAFLYLLDPTEESVLVLDLDGFFRERVDLSAELGRAGYRGFLPSRLLVGGSGDLWLLEPRAGRLLRLDRRGRFIEAPLDAMAGTERPRRIADATFASDDVLLLLDAVRPGIVSISTAGAPQPFEPLEGPLVEPASIAVDGGGLRYVFEANGRVRVIEPGGTIVWDGVVTGGPDGPHRSCVIEGGILCAANAAHGTIHRWRIARRGPEDAEH